MFTFLVWASWLLSANLSDLSVSDLSPPSYKDYYTRVTLSELLNCHLVQVTWVQRRKIAHLNLATMFEWSRFDFSSQTLAS